MTNYEKRLQSLNVDKLIELEDKVLECDTCYCKNFCTTKQSEESSCISVRKIWLLQELTDNTGSVDFNVR